MQGTHSRRVKELKNQPHAMVKTPRRIIITHEIVETFLADVQEALLSIEPTRLGDILCT